MGGIESMGGTTRICNEKKTSSKDGEILLREILLSQEQVLGWILLNAFIRNLDPRTGL